MPDTPEQKALRADLRTAFADVCYPGQSLTRSEWGRIARAVREVMELDADAAAVRAAAVEYHRQFPTMPCTPQALTGNWNRLQPQARGTGLREFVMDTWPEARSWPPSTWDTWNRELHDVADQAEAAIRMIARGGQMRPPTWGVVWKVAKELRAMRAEQVRLNEAAAEVIGA